MKLKPKERSAIMADEHPEIVRPYESGKPCPFTKGEQIVLRYQKTHGTPAPLVSITILGHNRTKNGSWKAEYSVRDDRGLYLARGLGYTRSAASSVDWEAGVEDQATLRAYAAQGRLHAAERREQRAKLKRDEEAVGKLLATKLCRLQGEAASYGLDLAPRIMEVVRELQGDLAKHRTASQDAA